MKENNMALDLNKSTFTQPLLKYLRLQRDNKRFANGVEIAITFFVITLFAVFAIRPTLLTISSLIGQNKAKEKSILAMKTKINNIIKAQDNFAQIQDDFPLIESSLPTNPNYGDAATQLEGVAQQSGLSLEKISYNLYPVDNLTSKTDSFSLVSSNKNTFAVSSNFIGNLLKNRRLVDFSAINFIIPKEGTGDQVEFSFTADFQNLKTVK